MKNHTENSCKGCSYYEVGDESVGLNAGCTHDSLYNEDEEIIDEMNDIICDYMLNGCPLKETKES